MPTVLIATIGKADIHLVFNAGQFRCPIDSMKCMQSIPPEMPLIWASDYKEKQLNESETYLADALTLHRLRIAIDSIAIQHVGLIDHLFLIATDRTKVINLLEELIPNLSDPRLRERADKYLQRSFDDTTMLSAKISKSLLESNAKGLPLNITKVTIVALGTGSYFESTPPILESMTSKSLDYFDINKADFFDIEHIEALHPYLEELNSSKIFICAWGGFPNQHKSLSRVLRSLLLHPDINDIHSDAERDSISLSNPQDEFLELHSNMHRAALEMDWMFVWNAFQEILNKNPFYFGDKTVQNLTSLVSSIEDYQKRSESWFSNFFVLIIKALYAQDYNSLFIWLKCMEEASFIAILEQPENQISLSYTLVKNVKLNGINSTKGSKLILNNGDSITAKFSEVWELFGKCNKMKHLDKFGKMFYIDSVNMKHGRRSQPNKHLMRITERRNSLIHSGKPIQRDPQLIRSLLNFLGVSESNLVNARLAQKCNDWETLIRFEKEVLNQSSFFTLMKSIAGIADPDWLPMERTSLRTYLQIIQQNFS